MIMAPTRPMMSETTPAATRPAALKTAMQGDEEEARLDGAARLRRDDLGDVADDHEAGRGAAGELEVEGPEAGRPDHLLPGRVGQGRRLGLLGLFGLGGPGICPGFGLFRNWAESPATTRKTKPQDAEGPADRPGSPAGPWTAARCRPGPSPNPATTMPGDQALLFRAEPFDRGRRRGGVAQADARAGQDAEPDDHRPDEVRPPQAGDDEARAAEDRARRGDDPRTEAVLEAAGGDHDEGETGDGDGIGQGRHRPRPAEAAVLNRFRQLLAEHAPGVEDTQGQVEAESCRGGAAPLVMMIPRMPFPPLPPGHDAAGEREPESPDMRARGILAYIPRTRSPRY